MKIKYQFFKADQDQYNVYSGSHKIGEVRKNKAGYWMIKSNYDVIWKDQGKLTRMEAAGKLEEIRNKGKGKQV